MVRVVVLGSKQAIFLNPGQVIWIREAGPAVCEVRTVDGELFRVLGPAQELAKKLATSEPESGEAVA